MKLINLFGGPGSGKSTSAAALFVSLKNRAIRAELVGEAAKDLIYQGQEVQLSNQLYVFALQYSRLKNLERSGCEVAISDSPLIMGTMYAQDTTYINELTQIARKVEADFETYNVFVKRTKPFDGFGRVQKTLEEAVPYDELANRLLQPQGFFLEITGDSEGQARLSIIVTELVEGKLNVRAVSTE